MDPKMDKGEGRYGESGKPMDQFHHNEAISAIVDEGFLAEEEVNNYEDLYNDDSGFQNDEVERVLVAMERVSVVVEEVRLWNLGFWGL